MNRKSIFLALGLLVGLTQVKPADKEAPEKTNEEAPAETPEEALKKSIALLETLNISEPTLLEKVVNNPLTSTTCAASVVGGAHWLSKGSYERDDYPGALPAEINMIKGSRFNTLKGIVYETGEYLKKKATDYPWMAPGIFFAGKDAITEHPKYAIAGIGGYFGWQFYKKRGYIQSQREDIDILLAQPNYTSPAKREPKKWVGPLPKELSNAITLLKDKPLQMAKFNLGAPSGFLLYGVPGTGKTFCIDHLAKILEVSLIKRKAADLKNALAGQTEKNIRDLLEEAVTKRQSEQNKLCIVFVDEIEGLIPKRENNPNSMQKDSATTFLQITQEGIKNGVLFIGATNHLDQVDAAMIRPGRLKPIEVDIPDTEERKTIFEWYFNNHKAAGQDKVPDRTLKKWATSSAGFTRADIQGAVEKAVMEAANSDKPELDPVLIDKAIDELSTTQRPTTQPWVGKLPKGIDETLRLIKNAKKAQLYNVSVPAGFFLHGKPGNGKTLIGKEIARRLDTEYIFQNGSELEDKFVGETSNKIATLFKKAAKRKVQLGKEHIVLIIDEADAIMSNRAVQKTMSGNGTGATQTFLPAIEEAAKQGVIVVATTNNIESVDNAILRSGRLKIIEITDPIEDDIADLLVTYLRHHHFIGISLCGIFDKPKVKDYAKNIFNIKDICRADVAEIVQGAALKAVLDEDEYTRPTLALLEPAIKEFKQNRKQDNLSSLMMYQ